MLVRLLYVSRSSAAITDDTVAHILSQSRRNNPGLGITGVLCVCADGVFLQVLEGGREEVNRLYARVLQDPRHKDVTLLDYEEVAERRFASWRMGRVDLDRVNAAIVLRFSEHPRLDPYRLSGPVALRLLEELAAACIVSGH